MDAFCRLYITPGDNHGNCVGNGPGITQTDGIKALINWVEKGIAPEDIHHIFKRFYRSRQSLDSPGIGLGLPLAKSIVEGQGGVITAQSTSGEGATFTVSFLTKL